MSQTLSAIMDVDDDDHDVGRSTTRRSKKKDSTKKHKQRNLQNSDSPETKYTTANLDADV